MKYAVAAMSFFENELKIEIVEAKDWFEALSKHSLFLEDGKIVDVSWIPNEINAAKDELFNADIVFDVIEIEGSVS